MCVSLRKTTTCSRDECTSFGSETGNGYRSSSGLLRSSTKNGTGRGLGHRKKYVPSDKILLLPRFLFNKFLAKMLQQRNCPLGGIDLLRHSPSSGANFCHNNCAPNGNGMCPENLPRINRFLRKMGIPYGLMHKLCAFARGSGESVGRLQSRQEMNGKMAILDQKFSFKANLPLGNCRRESRNLRVSRHQEVPAKCLLSVHKW